MAELKRVKKRKLNLKAVIILLLIIYLIAMLLYTIFTMPIKNIYIKGTNLLTDNEIIELAEIKDYPAIFSISKKKLEEKISTLELVESVEVKKTLTGKLTILVKETIPLFYNRNTNKLVLANHKEVDSLLINGVPTLINYVPDTLYERLVDELKDIDSNVLKLISEIEYQPWQSNDVMIDETRFFLRMTDGNSVYVNLINLSKLNSYIEIYASLEGKSGILYLDSSSDRISFSLYES